MKELDFLKEQITKYQLDTDSRNRAYVYKRYYVMYRLNKCKVSLTQIGKMLNRHHATVIHGIRMHRRWTRMQYKLYLHEIEPLVQAAVHHERSKNQKPFTRLVRENPVRLLDYRTYPARSHGHVYSSFV